MLRLKWQDIDFQRGYVTLSKPKGGVTRTVPVSDKALDVLRSLQVSTEYVFPGKAGPRTSFKGPWERIRKAAGLSQDFRLHGLRHHFASALVSSGVDLTVVRELLSHKDISTTQRYSHLRPDVVQEVARKSADIIKPSSEKKATVLRKK